MKYWDKLRSVEDQIVRLDTVESMLRVLGNADATREDMLNVLWYLDGTVEDINKGLNDTFYKLWDEIRGDSYKKNTSEYCTPTQSSNELMNIVNSWVKN